MGVYDTIEVGEKQGQVKLWNCNLADYSRGSKVPYGPHGARTYSIAMREGGFVNVRERVLESWTEQWLYAPIYDKWGGAEWESADYLG